MVILFCVGLMVAQAQVNNGQTKYWSNCLIEAVRAWLEDPSGTQIMYCPASLNEVFCSHWRWKTGDGLEHDFTTNESLRSWQYFWHEGGIRTRKRGPYARYINSMIKMKYYREQEIDSDDMIG